jgi:nucleotide-binding universal stress UspA family protein
VLRILVPLDGSSASEAAIPHAERLAAGRGEVHLLHAVPSFPSTLDASTPRVMELHDQALSRLGRLRKAHPGMEGLDLLRVGEPAGALRRASKDLSIDLIAMVTQGMEGAAEAVFRGTHVPLCLVRPGLPRTTSTPRRILVPLDGFEESFTVLAAGKRLALQMGAEVVVLPLSEGLSAPASRRARRDGFARVLADAETAEAIVAHARTVDADLIAMPTEGRTTIGNVARAVLASADRAVILLTPGVYAKAAVPPVPRPQKVPVDLVILGENVER